MWYREYGERKDKNTFVIFEWDSWHHHYVITATFEAGKDGVTMECLDMLEREYEREKRNEKRYGSGSIRFVTQRQLAHYVDSDAEEDAHLLDKLPDPNGDVYESAFPDAESKNERSAKIVSAVSEAISVLTPRQQKLFFDLYGWQKTQKKVASERGVSPQAVNQAAKRMEKSVGRILNQNGFVYPAA